MVVLKKSGIYLITNLTNNKHYIGSAINLSIRQRTHFNNLKQNKHCNKHLQASYNKHGIDNFKFDILWLCSKEDLLHYEQIYIDLWKPEYNICKTAGSTLGIKLSDETKLKMSLSSKGKPKSKEARINMSIGQLGNHKSSRLTKQDIIYLRETYKILNITQTELGAIYGIAFRTINAILNYKSWKEVA